MLTNSEWKTLEIRTLALLRLLDGFPTDLLKKLDARFSDTSCFRCTKIIYDGERFLRVDDEFEGTIDFCFLCIGDVYPEYIRRGYYLS